MKTKQVFLQYDKNGFPPDLNFKFCPHCGKDMAIIKKGLDTRNTCNTCGFVQYNNPFPGVAILIEKDDHVLLGQRRGSFGKDQWCLPCGFIEYEENFLQAAHREVFEETGLQIRIRSILSVTTNFLTPHRHTLAIILLAEVRDGEMCAGDDLKEVKWFPFSEPLPDMAFDADRHVIERYYRTRQAGASVDPDFALAEKNLASLLAQDKEGERRIHKP